MRKQFFIPTLMVGVLVAGAAGAFAQTATVVMRSGDRVRADVIDMGRNFTFNMNGEMRQVPIGDVVLIDMAGDGRNVPADEVSKANASGPLVVMRSGEQFGAALQDFTGKPLQAVFSNGRRAHLSEVSRIYMGSVNNVPGFPAVAAAAAAPVLAAPNPSSQAPAKALTAVVPGNVVWTYTGISVRQGQFLRFEPSGEIRLSFNGEDMAQAAGAASARLADKAPIPTIPVGALIGRVGNGQPFAIGNTAQALEMPANGRLSLGINDDHVADNSGNFVVKFWEP